jgi:hypothetical protein
MATTQPSAPANLRTGAVTRTWRYAGYEGGIEESLILVDGQQIGGVYPCSYNPAHQIEGWGHNDGDQTGESWASWGPRGYSFGHATREAAEQAQIREYFANPDLFDRVNAQDRAERAIERITDLYRKYATLDTRGKSGWGDLHAGVVAMTTMNMLSRFLAPQADVHASPRSEYAAINNGRTWVIVDTQTARTIPGMSPDTPALVVDVALAELASATSVEERQQIVDRHTAPLLDAPAPIEPDVMTRAHADAESALDKGDADALADALTRMGEHGDPRQRAKSLIDAGRIFPAQVRRRLAEMAHDNTAQHS